MSQKNLKKAQQQEAESSFAAEQLGKIAAEISISPIEDTHKAVFLYTIAQGSFTLSMYKAYQDLLKQYREGLLAEAKRVEEQLESLEDQLYETQQALSEAAEGAVKEVQVACEHIEQSVEKELETRTEAKSGAEVAALRKKLTDK